MRACVFFVVTLNRLWPWSRPFCAMINDGVRRRSSPERELNYKQNTHSHKIHLLVPIATAAHLRRWLDGGKDIYDAYCLAGRNFSHCIIYVTFPFRLFHQRAHILRPPPPRFYQSLSTRAAVAAAASRHWSVRRESAYYFVSTVLRRLHARRHFWRPWRVKHFLRVGGSKSTTPPPFCLQHELGIYLSDLMHSLLPQSTPPFVFTMLIVLLFVLFMHTYIILYIHKYMCSVCVLVECLD